MESNNREGGGDDPDLLKMIKHLEETHHMDVSKLDRKSSVLIATAKVMTQNEISITTLPLELPQFVQSNLNDMLLPHLSAIKLDGFQKQKKCKAFVIGNTGKT